MPKAVFSGMTVVAASAITAPLSAIVYAIPSGDAWFFLVILVVFAPHALVAAWAAIMGIAFFLNHLRQNGVWVCAIAGTIGSPLFEASIGGLTRPMLQNVAYAAIVGGVSGLIYCAAAHILHQKALARSAEAIKQEQGQP